MLFESMKSKAELEAIVGVGRLYVAIRQYDNTIRSDARAKGQLWSQNFWNPNALDQFIYARKN